MFPYKKLFWLAVFAAAGYYILPHSLPILAALITAIVLEPIVKSLVTGIKVPRTYAVILTFAGFLLLFGGLTFVVTTRIVLEVVELSAWLPDTVMRLSEPVLKWLGVMQTYIAELNPGTASSIQTALNGVIGKLNNLTITLLNGIVTVFKSLPNLLVVWLVYLVSLFLFSLDLPGLARQFLSLFDEEGQVKVKLVLANLNRAIIGFLQAQVLISFLTYDLVLVGLWILDVKYALAIALMIVVVDVLPVLGTGAVIVPWSLYAFFTGNQALGVGLLVLYLVIIVFRRIIEPKILGQSLGISALATLISMYLGFMVFGFLGLIVGPALVILFQAFRDAGLISPRIRL